MLEIIYHKRNPLITNTESETNSNKKKTMHFFEEQKEISSWSLY